MAYNKEKVSALTQGLSGEDWEDLVAWGGELYDPLFQGDVGFVGAPTEHQDAFTPSHHGPESVTSEYMYEPSSATSVVEEPLFGYTISGPPSIAEELSSSGRNHSWLSASPSYTTTATSPLLARDGSGHGGSFEHGLFNGCEDNHFHLPTSTASPRIDAKSFGSSSSYHTASASIFNPHLAGSPHAFSGQDVFASQAFANLGTWAETIIEPIPENEHAYSVNPIPIPQSGSQSFSNALSHQPWSTEAPQQQTRARAITIPGPHRPNLEAQSQLWAHQVPPILSVSPDAKRLPRSAPLTRSISRGDSRRSRNRLTNASPTTIFSWVSYQPSAQSNRLVASSSEGRGKRPRGRTGALTPQQRSHAAIMRRFVSCSNCKKRKERCDTGIPCKSCLDHYKGDLINHPCRDRLLSHLSSTFLSERFAWHPTVRAIESFAAPGSYQISRGLTYPITLHFGFGPALPLSVNPVQIHDTDALCHEHVIYFWPPSHSSKEVHTHAVLPAVLTPEATSNLQETLDTHLSLLVRQYFRSFPLYRSPLRILHKVYVFYRSFPPNTPHSRLLHQALKLLVLVHIGGDITLPSPSNDLIIQQLIHNTMTLSEPVTPTPCLIRSQFGSVMPSLAMRLMKEVLQSLELLFLNRECHEWPVALATLIIILMTVESIQYHAAKLPYHHSYDSGVSSRKQEPDISIDDEGVKSLLAFYSSCFQGCHARLSADWQGEAISSSQFQDVDALGVSPEDKFVESVREAIHQTPPADYLHKKAIADRVGDDMGFFFDRLVARLLTLQTHEI